MYLEKWLHTKILESAGKEAAPGRSAVERYQLLKLQQVLRYAYKNSSFYRSSFDQNGINPEDVSSLQDLSKLPFTQPQHLADSPYRFLCLSQAEVARSSTFVTSGTTGPQKKIFWTQGDLDRITDFMAAGMGVVAGPGDVVQIILPDGRPNSQADLLSKGVNRFGAAPVVTAFDLSAEEQIKIIHQFRPAVIFGYTNRLFRISKELQTSHDLSVAGVKILFLASEYLPDAMRSDLQSIWNCRVHTHYGLTEMGLGVAVECTAQNGYHFNEADLLLEIVDPNTGKTVLPGVEGELVFTTLTREAMPLIRYRTHDLSRFIPEPCPCGAGSMLKFAAVKKRLESTMRTESGDELYPALFDDLLFSIPGLVDYQATLQRHENKDQLFFKIEMAQQGMNPISEIIKRLLSAPEIARNISIEKMLQPEVEFVRQGMLRSESRAKRLIVDCR
jgi:phenylacetate-CoA ligase